MTRSLTIRWAPLLLVTSMIWATAVNATPAGATSNQVHLMNAWKALEGDFNRVQSSIRNNNVSAAETAFYDYSRDCIPLATFETTFGALINSDIFSIAQLGNAWAWMGYVTLASNSSVGPFQTETSRLNNAIIKFTHDLTNNGF